MNDLHEIIVTTKNEPSKQRIVQFSDLYSIRNDIKSIMFLWNTNCYYINVSTGVFIVNGGRRIQFPGSGDYILIYRRRNIQTYDLQPTDENVKSRLQIRWILGIEDKDTKSMLLLVISSDGSSWQWANKL
jgi:hypothetical protein